MDEVLIFNRPLTAAEIQSSSVAMPVITLTSPGQAVKYKPGEAGIATVTATNPNGIVKLYCNASGAVSEGTHAVFFDPPQPDVTQQVTFRVAPDAAPHQSYRLSCVAETAAGIMAVSNLDLQAADVLPATVKSSSRVISAASKTFYSLPQ